MKSICLWLIFVAVPLLALNAQSDAGPPIRADLSSYLRDVQTDFSQTFVPMGWSKDGKFASIQISAVLPPSPDPTITYVIFDTVEDAVVWSRSDDSSSWLPQDREAEDKLPLSWSQNSVDFKDAMKKAGISLGQGVQFLPFPLKAGGDVFSCQVVKNGQKSETKIVVASEKKGRKTVTSLPLSDETDETAYAAGYFVSPWEPRILVVVAVQQPVMDAASLMSFHFSGCLLTKGFSPAR